MTLARRVALGLLAALFAGVAWAAPGEPPFRITADNLTGGRGPQGDLLFLNGHLRVTRGRTLLTADAGRYDRTTGLIVLEGNVHLVDTTTTVTCRQASFSETDDRLNLEGDVRIRDKAAELRAPFGWYDRRNGIAQLNGGVRAVEGRQEIHAEQATWVRDSSVIEAFGNVRGFDAENNAELYAQSVRFNRRSRIAVATGEPQLRQKDSDERWVVVHARTLRVDQGRRTAEAIDSVRVERDTLQARADYAFFDDDADRGILVGRPRAWDQETTVTGDTLEMLTTQRRLQRVVVRGHAVMDYEGRRATNRGERSRLVGERVEAFVHENEIDSLIAFGGARNDYAAARRPGRTAEQNSALGDTITVYFAGRKVDRARVTGNASGEYRAAVADSDTVAVRSELVRYTGRAIEYVVPRSQIILEGRDTPAELEYRDLRLQARKVVFDSDRQTLVASGSPQLVDRNDNVQGHLMTYDLETRTGTIYDARTTYERGLYHGERIRKAGDNVLDVLNGAYSTCDLDAPHYHFSAHYMKIYLKDKLVAKPVVFWVRNVPLLALPFYVFPIKAGRHSGFLFPQFQLGFNSTTGQYLRNAGYYWAPNEYFDLTAAADYAQLGPVWQLKSEGRYNVLYRLNGQFSGTFNHDEFSNQDNWKFDANHYQTLSGRTSLSATASFVSSRTFNGDAFSGTLEDRLRRFLVSSLSLAHNGDWGSLSAYLDRRQDLDADQALVWTESDDVFPPPAVGTTASLPNLTQSEPSLSVTLPTRTLGSFGFLRASGLGKGLQSTYAGLSGRFLSYRERRARVSGYQVFGPDSALDSTTVLDQSVRVRRGFAGNASLSDSRRLLGWINFAPSINSNLAVFDFDRLGNRVVPAATWSAGAGLGTTLYGTFRPPIPGLAGLRHVVSPNLSLSYSPEFRGLTIRDSLGNLQNRFESFGSIGISGFRSAALGFSLDQRFQAKVERRGGDVLRLDNLLAWTTSGSYNFLWREQGARRGLSPLNSIVRVQPPGALAGDFTATIDVYEGRPLRRFSWSTSTHLNSQMFRPGGRAQRAETAELAVESATPRAEIAPAEIFRDDWSLGMSYSYSGGYLGRDWSAQQNANGVFGWTPTPNWRFDYSLGYDVTQHVISTQRFSLTRRIHCWDAVFTRSFIAGGEAEYYFRIGVRDQRELYFERGTRVQSFGGIQ